MWKLALPVNIVRNGLAILPDGTMVFALLDGKILSVGAPTNAIRPAPEASRR